MSRDLTESGYYDNWKTSPPEPEVLTECAQCRQDIYEREPHYFIESTGDYVHSGSCFVDYAIDHLGADYRG